MKFKEVISERTLMGHITNGGYPGGTKHTDETKLEPYIKSKTFTDGTKATAAYKICSWMWVTNVKDAENRLLNKCSEEEVCPYNHHAHSNLSEKIQGIVYVLHD